METSPRRIASFLPAATEMACALGLEPLLVGVSHECDHPASVREKPVVVRNAVEFAALGPSEIDAEVSARLEAGESLYAVDETLMRALEPDLILTQDLCQVCAPSGNDITRLLFSLERKPDVLYFTPRTLADVDDDLRRLGDATGRRAEADALILKNRRRLDAVERRIAKIDKRPRVFFAEWVDPVYCAGHWVPEMIERAGGEPVLACPGEDSVRVSREEVMAAKPDVLIVAPCGYSLSGAISQAGRLGLTASRMYAVDANAYFARPGPRLVDGVELLAHLLHPDVAEPTPGSATGFRELL
jgi:iron complex transport system substrate-binding protein